MRNGYKVTLGILTVMILITITIGTSYSYYTVSDAQSTPNTLTSTCFNISYDEGSESINLSGLDSNKYAYPMSEATATSKLTPYSFTITNTCSEDNSSKDINYVITLGTLIDKPSSLPISYLRYKLNLTSPTSTPGTAASLNTPYDLMNSIKQEQNIDTSYSIATGTLAPGAHKTYNLYLWIDEGACNGDECETKVMGKTFNGRVVVYSYI
ncbi:MAG: hypothetical protein K2J20_01030 [Bacilli bacterium]|nr:hypothetical protein [Bacilli bacterium]